MKALATFVLWCFVFVTLAMAAIVQGSRELEFNANKSATAWRAKHQIISNIDQITD